MQTSQTQKLEELIQYLQGRSNHIELCFQHVYILCVLVSKMIPHYIFILQQNLLLRNLKTIHSIDK